MGRVETIAGVLFSPFSVALAAGFVFILLVHIAARILSPRSALFRVGAPAGDTRAEVVDWAGGAGYVTADGELWRASSKSSLSPGDEVRIKSVKGLTLEVTRVKTGRGG
ncbi:MAG: NfeD family protein [Parvularculaceae bacterium]|nr:NfeD family protein [Parvularculaceae bacterium]